jgi:hypothetical protein
MEQTPSSEANRFSTGLEIPHILRKGSLPHSQVPATCPYPEYESPSEVFFVNGS